MHVPALALEQSSDTVGRAGPCHHNKCKERPVTVLWCRLTTLVEAPWVVSRLPKGVFLR